MFNVVQKLFDLQILYAFSEFIILKISNNFNWNSEINIISLKFHHFNLMVFSLIILKVYKQIMDQKLQLTALPI